jgi:hypothetical protein
MECVMKRKWIKQVKGETHEPREGPRMGEGGDPRMHKSMLPNLKCDVY